MVELTEMPDFQEYLFEQYQQDKIEREIQYLISLMKDMRKNERYPSGRKILLKKG